MSRSLTYLRKNSLAKPILSRAVPDVRVDSVAVVGSVGGPCWLLVTPNHYEFWTRFKKSYPHWKRLARKYGVLSSVTGTRCPVFSTQKGLLSWLSDVLNLPSGERNLLYLMENIVG